MFLVTANALYKLKSGIGSDPLDYKRCLVLVKS